ncbi:putative alcohol dehydrogenase [Pseudomonas syringae pv. broussonetiae]|uniref:Putative alcohol dehydrogenase n=1 Tax=Pseudomonas savastanoi TaxID=29438 RepID=A0A3M5AZC9_PSESS|nr:putative alcohol dehydrogenase [Pseudomonas syringae pv. broussonetiae]RMS18003.1 putative alcohol dehydrogenase [Pseudomonas savastanoi]RMT20511.1 putative alcohol dehydrogenase [Pseudomonas savastanoi]
MKAWLLKDFGLDNLVLGEAETPVPKAGELLVKVGAVSLNFRDKAIVDGIYEPHRVPKPLIPVSDAAGTVTRAGSTAHQARTSRISASVRRCRVALLNT